MEAVVAVPLPGRFDACKLREARLALGLSQVQAAQRVGVSPSVFNSWESRGRRPSVRNLARVAAALGLSVSDLFAADSDVVGTLIELRVRAGLTQLQLAAELGVSQTQVSDWERGLSRPTSDEAGLYAVLVGVDEGMLSAAIDGTPKRVPKARKPREALAGSSDAGGRPVGAPALVVGDLGQAGGEARVIFLDFSRWARFREVEEYAERRSIDLGKAIRELVEHALSPLPSVPRTPRVTPGDR